MVYFGVFVGQIRQSSTRSDQLRYLKHLKYFLIRNQREILRFLTPFVIFQKKNFLGHISTFFKLWSHTRKKRLKKSKNVFCKCVLDFNFAPIKGSVFFISKKKSNSLYPSAHLSKKFYSIFVYLRIILIDTIEFAKNSYLLRGKIQRFAPRFEQMLKCPCSLFLRIFCLLFRSTLYQI